MEGLKDVLGYYGAVFILAVVIVLGAGVIG